jgi:hypothetical protein
VWWYNAVISALGRLKQKDQEFKVSLGCLARPCLKKEKEKKEIQSNPNYCPHPATYKLTQTTITKV